MVSELLCFVHMASAVQHVCSAHNVALAVQDAMQSMIGVLDAEPDPQAAFNLVLCTYALGDKEMMKQAFSKLVEVGMLPLYYC